MKRIPNYSDYIVSRIGEVYSTKTMIKMRQYDKRGYRYTTVVDDNGKSTKIGVHRLVGYAYIPMVEGKNEINHINGDKSDNRVENLEWCDTYENNAHAAEMGLGYSYPSVSKVRQRWLCALYVRRRYTVNYLSELSGFAVSYVRRILEWRGVYEPNRSYYSIDYDRVEALFKTGLFTSDEIASICRCTRVMVNKIRRERKLEAYVYYRDEAIKHLCADNDSVMECVLIFRVSENKVRSVSGVHRPTPEPEYAIKDLVRFKSCVERGMTIKQLAAEFECGDDSVFTALKRTGLKTKGKRKYDYDRIRELREQGLSYARIAEQLGCSSPTIASICQQNGWGGKKADSGYWSHKSNRE